MPERPKGHDWKSCVRPKVYRGFESPSLRQIRGGVNALFICLASLVFTFPLLVSKRRELFFRHAEEMGDFMNDGNFDLLL